MPIQIGMNNFTEDLLDDIKQFESDKISIKITNKQNRLLPEPPSLEIFAYALASDLLIDLIKRIFSLLYLKEIKLIPEKTDIKTIGKILLNNPNINVIYEDNRVIINDNHENIIINYNFHLESEKKIDSAKK